MTQSRVSVAKDFSKYPAGRFIADGPASGEEFRERFLLPALRNNNSLIIELDGTRGYGSSFLEEAFGGAVREGFGPDFVRESIELVTDDESLKEEIYDYIDHGANPE
ncbi:MAG: STAS-like domain-containing protein [Nitrospira sp.]|nr:STAS-like domain-containing protein [Nitrospira sp.]MCA9476876.1 STAS-like domain-containing protein [Nitrospira sp.]